VATVGSASEAETPRMRSFALLLWISLAAASSVKREVDSPEEKADEKREGRGLSDIPVFGKLLSQASDVLGLGPKAAGDHGSKEPLPPIGPPIHGGYPAHPPAPHVTHSEAPPECIETPHETCHPRQVETPRKVCQQVADIHEDTVITEHCEDIVTHVCTHETSHHTQGIVDSHSNLIEAGVPVDPLAIHGHGPGPVGPVGHGPVVPVGHGPVDHPLPVGGVHPPTPYHGDPGHFRRRSAQVPYHAEPVHPVPVAHPVPHPVHHDVTTRPVCTATPQKTCEHTPNSKPRKVYRTICHTVVDITHIQDCTETLTKTCQHTSAVHTSHSEVTGHDTHVVAEEHVEPVPVPHTPYGHGPVHGPVHPHAG